MSKSDTKEKETKCILRVRAMLPHARMGQLDRSDRQKTSGTIALCHCVAKADIALVAPERCGCPWVASIAYHQIIRLINCHPFPKNLRLTSSSSAINSTVVCFCCSTLFNFAGRPSACSNTETKDRIRDSSYYLS